MTWMLITGLVWLSLSALVGVVIGLMVHRADVRDDEDPAVGRSPLPVGPRSPRLRGRARGREMVASAVGRANHPRRRRPPTPAPQGDAAPEQHPPD